MSINSSLSFSVKPHTRTGSGSSSSINRTTTMTTPGLSSTASNTGDFGWSLNITSQGESCVDIKQFLWQKSGDLTALPVTMCVFAVVYSTIVTLGVVGNCLVIISVYRHRSLQSVRNIFIVSLSCSDVVVSIVSGTITPITAFTKVWLFGAALCKLVPLIQGTSLCFSTLTLTAISIDRFILIIYPTRRSIQKRHAFRMVLLNWLIATGISTPMFFKQVLIDFDNFCGQFCAEDWGNDQSGRSTYGTLVFVLQFVIPFLVITFCYLMISLKLSRGMMLRNEAKRGAAGVSAGGVAICARKCKSDESANSVPVLAMEHKISFVDSPMMIRQKKKKFSIISNTAYVNGESEICAVNTNGVTVNENCAPPPAIVLSEQRQMALKRRLRTNRMLMAMVGVFLCCWTPSVVFNFLRDYQWLPSVVSDQEYLCGIVTHFISMSSTVWNPILYALLNEQFRLAFITLLRKTPSKRGIFAEESNADSTGFGSSFVPRLLRYPRLISNICLSFIATNHRVLSSGVTGPEVTRLRVNNEEMNAGHAPREVSRVSVGSTSISAIVRRASPSFCDTLTSINNNKMDLSPSNVTESINTAFYVRTPLVPMFSMDDENEELIFRESDEEV